MQLCESLQTPYYTTHSYHTSTLCSLQRSCLYALLHCDLFYCGAFCTVLTGKAVGVPGDLSTAEGVAAVVEKVDALGQLEVLVNNVGIFGVKDFFELTDDDWQHYYDVNVMSTVRMSRHFLKSMLERKTGRIVNVAR
jgi:NAD(P)-dependent dehydrogenase (short-subunit alcohol dehydrogenase family)